MIIIPRLKYWLKALELFIVQIPVSLFSFFFSLAVSIVFASNGALFTLIFFSIFLSTSSLLFAYYYDWGKDKPRHGIKFLPSKPAFCEGIAMAFIAFFSNMIASILLESPTQIPFFIILWVYIASYSFSCRDLRKKKRP